MKPMPASMRPQRPRSTRVALQEAADAAAAPEAGPRASSTVEPGTDATTPRRSDLRRLPLNNETDLCRPMQTFDVQPQVGARVATALPVVGVRPVLTSAHRDQTSVRLEALENQGSEVGRQRFERFRNL